MLQMMTLLIVWNVGQGQWVTLAREHSCEHYDAGGEFKPSSANLKKYCGSKDNLVFFSHWDWDHIGLIKYLDLQLPRVCIAQMPGGESNDAKMRMLKALPACSKKVADNKMLTSQDAKTANANSHVFLTHQVLIPGDSPTSQEKQWLHQLPQPLTIQTLILGHHGSRTSTGFDLLNFLPNLKMAIASARSSRYGHPHLQTLFRLQKQGIPVLRTEDWGSIVRPLSTVRN